MGISRILSIGISLNYKMKFQRVKSTLRGISKRYSTIMGKCIILCAFVFGIMWIVLVTLFHLCGSAKLTVFQAICLKSPIRCYDGRLVLLYMLANVHVRKSRIEPENQVCYPVFDITTFQLKI